MATFEGNNGPTVHKRGNFFRSLILYVQNKLFVIN